ncbi:mRNA-capping enzyme subunit beta [Sorochytrium milnesiophthora]
MSAPPSPSSLPPAKRKRSDANDTVPNGNEATTTAQDAPSQPSPSAAAIAATTTPRAVQLQPSIFNAAPMPDIQRVVTDFISDCLKHPAAAQALANPNGGTEVEIEAKLGRLVWGNRPAGPSTPGVRIDVPVFCETVINMRDIRFESDMTMVQHSHYNQMLNNLVGQSSSRIKYKHVREVDRFYQEPGPGKSKVRATYTQDTNALVAVVRKHAIKHLNVYVPTALLDYRITVNIEQTVDLPKGIAPDFQRMKDRIMYTHEIVRVDLTQVKTNDKKGPRAPAAGGAPFNPYRQADASAASDKGDEWRKTHEVELEFLNVRRNLGHELEKSERGQSSRFADNVGIFVNSIKMLALKAPREAPPAASSHRP